MLTGPSSDRFFDIIATEISSTIDSQIGFAGRIIVVLGAALGFIWGEIQSQLILLLAH